MPIGRDGGQNTGKYLRQKILKLLLKPPSFTINIHPTLRYTNTPVLVPANNWVYYYCILFNIFAQIKNMVEIELTQREKNIIQEIAQIQISSLVQVLNGEIEEDIPMFCIERDIQQKDLLEAVEKNLRVFEEIIEDPNKFFVQDRYNMKISTHVLLRYFRKRKHGKARRSIYRKICILEDMPITLN